MGFVLNGYPLISETFIANEIRFLEKQGFTVHIFALRRPRENVRHSLVGEIKATAHYLPDKFWKNPWYVIKHNLTLARKKPATYARALLTACRGLVHTRQARVFKRLAQAACLVQDLSSGRGVRHWHAHFAHSPTSVAMFASLLSGLPYSFTAHAVDIYTTPAWLLKEHTRSADYVVTCTEYNRQYLSEAAAGLATPIHRIYHGVDLGFFCERPFPGPPRSPYRLLTVARLIEKKGLATMYQALSLLRDQGFEFKHVLIGDGPDRARVLSLIDELDLGDFTLCPGTQPHEVVLEYYRQADLFVLGCEIAANGDRDGLPNVLVESMAVGVPVVTTSVSAIPELVEDGLTGLLVRPGAPKEMAAAMARLLTDNNLRAKVVARARARVAERFDIRTAGQELAALHGRGLTVGPGVGLK